MNNQMNPYIDKWGNTVSEFGGIKFDNPDYEEVF